MKDMSLHILDIAENSIEAGATRVEISLRHDIGADRFVLRVEDDGRGVETEKKETDRFYTSKGDKRFGLGIPLLAQAARECNGEFSLDRKKAGRGTVLTAVFQRSHIDMKPLGDVGATLATLLAGHPEVDYVLDYEVDGSSFRLDTGDIRKELEGLPLNFPSVLQYVQEQVTEGIRRTNG